MTPLIAHRCAVFSALLVLAGCGAGPRQAETAASTASVPSTIPAAESPRHSRVSSDPLAGAPRIAAARLRRDAARAAAIAAGVLPDPMVDAQYLRMADERADGAMVEVGQTFPRWGERDGMRAMAAADLAMAEAEFAMVRGEVLSQLAMQHARIRAAEAQAVAYRETAARAERLADLVARAAAATGGARLAEVLTLRSRAASLVVLAQEAERQAADARGRIRALLRLPAEVSLPDPGVADPTRQMLEQTPKVRLAAAELARSKAEQQIAASRSHPEFGVRASWEREDITMDDDEFRIGLTVAIPLRPAAWRGPLEAAGRRQDAAVLDREAALADAGELLARVERARQQAARSRLVADETIQRLGLELDNVASAAGTGEMNGAAMLFERLDMLSETRVMAVMATADADMAAAELWMLFPTPDNDEVRP